MWKHCLLLKSSSINSYRFFVGIWKKIEQCIHFFTFLKYSLRKEKNRFAASQIRIFLEIHILFSKSIWSVLFLCNKSYSEISSYTLHGALCTFFFIHSRGKRIEAQLSSQLLARFLKWLKRSQRRELILFRSSGKKRTRYRIYVSVFGRRSIIHMGERLKSSVSSASGRQNPRFYCECKNNEQNQGFCIW